MKIIEKEIIGKKSQKMCEDGIVVTDNFIAVIDGSTSKTSEHISPIMKNGRYSMLLVERFIRNSKAEVSCEDFCNGVTKYIASVYPCESCLPPEQRLTASAIVYSVLRNEIWMIGDCQCLIDGILYSNDKPYEQCIANKRVNLILQQGMSPENARQAIIPELIEAMHVGQNKEYAVIDGTPIYMLGIRKLNVKHATEIVLASDGYPFLKSTLHDSESELSKQLKYDPQNLYTFKATKGLMDGNRSFDDRAYIRFSI